jgi:hypothetical protein
MEMIRSNRRGREARAAHFIAARMPHVDELDVRDF